MGSGSSRLGLRPSRPPRPDRPNRSFLSSLLICGGSASLAPTEMEDDPSELLVNSMKQSELMVEELHNPTKESALASGARTGLISPETEAETGASSECSIRASDECSFKDGLINAERSDRGKCLCKSKELTPNHISTGYSNHDTASTSYEDQPFSDSVSTTIRSHMDVVNGADIVMEKDNSQVCVEVIHPSSSSPQEVGDSHTNEVSVESHVSEGMTIHNSDSGSDSVVSVSPVTSQSLQDDTLQETIPPGLGFLVSDREQDWGGGSVLQVDTVGISSSILSSSSTEASNGEVRRNSRRLFWDAFSRRSSRRHSDSQTFVFSTEDADGLGSHDRWLLDFSGDFFHDGVGHDSGYMGSRIHSINEWHRHPRSEVWERLHGGREGGNPRTSICPSGLHPDGTCSCESILMAEESGTHASISRIVMLAEALFEVLDEIHRQPVPLSLSVVSRLATESIVDSFPVKYHRKPHTTESADDAARCYICLSEYEESDKIRILPCHHEFHMSCVDKWLKEIHGVCPLCRGDVHEGFTEGSVLNSETTYV